jgi:hypothetical protein
MAEKPAVIDADTDEDLEAAFAGFDGPPPGDEDAPDDADHGPDAAKNGTLDPYSRTEKRGRARIAELVKARAEKQAAQLADYTQKLEAKLAGRLDVMALTKGTGATTGDPTKAREHIKRLAEMHARKMREFEDLLAKMGETAGDAAPDTASEPEAAATA